MLCPTVTGTKYSTPPLTALTHRLPNKITNMYSVDRVLRVLDNIDHTTPPIWAGEAKNYHPKHALAYAN